jgi:membrane protein implicated in regulation of membrane protease activity
MNLYIWLFVALVAFIVEMATPSALLTIWFTIGASFAALLTYLDFNFFIQIIGFILVSSLSFVFLRPFLVKLVKVKATNTNADRLIGTEVTLTESLSSEKWGAVEIAGLRYSVSCTHPTNLEKGTLVKVVALKGARLIVEKVKGE